VLDGGTPHTDVPLMLTEFGGIAVATDGTWGYSVCRTPAELADRYQRLMAAIRSLGLLAGFCYTQFSDTYQEANGLLYADRTPKFPLAQIASATSGPTEPHGLEQLELASSDEVR
jgi:hypothetical protein